MRALSEVFPSVQAATGDRAGQVGRVLLIGLGAVVGVVAIALLAHWLGRAFSWMVEKRWPIALYAVAALGVAAGGYVAEETLVMWAGFAALVLPVLLLMFLALIGF